MSGKNRKAQSPNVKGKNQKISEKIAEKAVSPTKKGTKSPKALISSEKKNAAKEVRAEKKVSPTAEKKLTPAKKNAAKPAVALSAKKEPAKKVAKPVSAKKVEKPVKKVEKPVSAKKVEKPVVAKKAEKPAKKVEKPVVAKKVEKPVSAKKVEKPAKKVEKPVPEKKAEKPVAKKVEKPVSVKKVEKPVPEKKAEKTAKKAEKPVPEKKAEKTVKKAEKPVPEKKAEKPAKKVEKPVPENKAEKPAKKVEKPVPENKAEKPAKKVEKPVPEKKAEKPAKKAEKPVPENKAEKPAKKVEKPVPEKKAEKKIKTPKKSLSKDKKDKDEFIIPEIPDDEPPYQDDPEPSTTDDILTEDLDDQEAYKEAKEEAELEEEKKPEESDEKKKDLLKSVPLSASKNDTMKVYMQDIGQIPLVSKNEEVELAGQIHGADSGAHDVARSTLIQANLRLVVKIAHDFKGLGLPLLDLISEGNIGLMRAVEKFDPAKGAKFSSYAAWWIKQSMRRALANQSRTIRIPVQSAGKINKIKSVRMRLTEQFGREPTDAEIASNLAFSERTVAGLRLADLKTFSLHDPIQQGEDGEFQDIIPDRGAMTPDRILGDVESIKRLIDLLRDLDERERMILKMRFGLDGHRPRTLEEVSQEIGRTRERVRQIQNQALGKLKMMLADEADFTND